MTELLKEGEYEEFTLRLGDSSVAVAVNNRRDAVQTYHQWGIFYEENQLIAHRNLIFHHSTVIDIGANVGNHTCFYAFCTSANRVYPFEPNIEARKVLLTSVSLNNHSDKVDQSYIDCALGAAAAEMQIAGTYENNLGATHYEKRPVNSDTTIIRCVRLDSLTFEGDVSLLKIDVEGGEIDVLTGAAGVIKKYRPSIAVEVNEINETAFWRIVSIYNYQVIDMIYESKGVRNYIMIPRQ